MSHKMFLFLVLTLSCMVIIIVSVLNYVVDPLQFFRKAAYPPSFSEKQRYQNPGLAKNYDFDTVILGTSVTENFDVNYVNNKMNCRALKLSISGGTLKEEYLTAKLVLDVHKVKTVIWSIDIASATGDKDRVREDYGPFPYYLYDDNMLNKLQYLLSGSTSIYSLKVIGYLTGLKVNDSKPLEQLNNWQSDYTFGKDETMESWRSWRRLQNNILKPEDYDIEKLKISLRKNVFSLIRANPNVNFLLFFPPYSMPFHRWCYEREPMIVYNSNEAKQYIINELGNEANVKIYDFQDEYEIVENLDNYKDIMHYSQNINQHIIDEIATSKTLDYSNTTERYEKFIQKVKEYPTLLP